jgi:hypothetical protein
MNGKSGKFQEYSEQAMILENDFSLASENGNFNIQEL